MTDWIETFLNYIIQEKGLSEKTWQSYQQGLHEWNAFIESIPLISSQHVTHHHVRSYVAYCHRKGLSPKSIAQKLSAIRSFYTYAHRRGWMDHNPAKGVRSPKQAKRLPKTLEVDELDHFLDAIPADDFVSIRDKAIMELFYSSGIRLSELQSLTLQAIDLNDGSVRVVGKGNKERIAPLGRKAKDAILEWLKERALVAQDEQSAVFITQKGNALKHRSIQARLEYWGKRLGISSRLHPHKLRHSCASHFLESASDLRAVQELLGHANLSTTQIYTHLDFQHLANVFDKAHPRAKKKNHD